MNTAHSSQQGTRPTRIGIFDSGVGGLSILDSIHATLPTHPLLYYADSAHAPYGERSDDYVRDRSLAIAQELLQAGCGLLVVACNTATAVAATAIRQRWPDVPVVGVEPAVKPAALSSRNKRVGVMATSSTLRSERFNRLLEKHTQGVSISTQACVGLARAIEAGDLQSPEVQQLVHQYCGPLRQAGVDTVVLGCTHYAFVATAIQAEMGPGVAVIHTAEAVARETARQALALDAQPAAPAGPGTTPSIELRSSGDTASLQAIARRWLPQAFATASPV